MTGETVKIINDAGYRALYELAVAEPDLFLEPNPALLIERVKMAAGLDEVFGGDLPIACSMSGLNGIADLGLGGNPSQSDVQYGLIVRDALQSLTPRQAAERRVWASINCFILSDYVPVRWPTSNLKRGDHASHIASHWLKLDREKNAAGRLWWQAEIARRMQPFSEHDAETLRLVLANNPSFYHRLLYRPLLLRMPKLAATVCDLALRGNEHLYQQKHLDVLVKKLLDIAANSSLDLMPTEQLQQIVRDNAPKKV